MSTTPRSLQMNEKQRQKDSRIVEITVPRKVFLFTMRYTLFKTFKW